jgi:cytochrome P450
VPFAGRLPSRARHAHRAAAGVLESVLSPAVVARRAKPREDVLTLLVEAHADEPTDVAAAHALDEARTFLASYEVSSTALAWALHVVAEHPDAQALVAGSGEAGTLGDAQRVVSETLRLYPPSWLFSRVALEGVELPTGHRLPASSRVFLSPWATHRDPRWFPDPERFDPDRFLPGAAKARARYAYFPFGGGPHVCIGEGLARTEAALVIGALCRRLELALVPGTAATPTPRVTLELGGSPRIRVVPRRPA